MQIVGTGVLDGPSPTHRGLLSDLCYSRTVEDASPYESNLFVGFKQSAKLQFTAYSPNSSNSSYTAISSSSHSPLRVSSSAART